MTSTFKYKCNKIVKQHYLELWTKKAHSLREGKLRTYLKIKTNVGYENYVSIIKNFEQRRWLSKLRISAHKLQIEIGRSIVGSSLFKIHMSLHLSSKF
jgi:hypothetical protein